MKNIKRGNMEKQLFEMCFELEEILEANDSGYQNVYDISVTGNKTFLLADGVVSHNSAVGGLIPALGREEYGFYAMRGVPLNAYDSSQQKFTGNKELSEIYSIIQNEGCVFEEEGDWYELEINNEKITVNENDEIQIKNKWISVRDIISGKYKV